MRKTFLLISALLAFALIINGGCNNKANDKEQIIDIETADESTVDSLVLAFTEQILKNPDNDDLYYKRAKVYLKNEKVMLAIADMEKAVELESEIVEYQNFLGDIYFQVTNVQGAIDAYLASTALNPSHEYAFLQLGKIYLYRAEPKIAIGYLNEALKINKYNPEIFSNKALYYLQMNDTVRAISNLKTAVDVDPDYLNGYIDLGYLYALDLDKRALLYFENALRIEPQNMQVLYNRGKYYQDMAQFELAIIDYESILKIYPDHKSANYNLGYINYLMGNFELAIQFFSTASFSNPNYSAAYYGIGLCYKEIGKQELAKENFEKVLSLEPEDELAQIELNKLR
ncbi:MAG: tetratricopeptide repeat protein [Bacteroidetes bacterium]|nr:tetratricopeptide repeat protein [Bacteroidota bacterium]MBT5529534.1 tetratricopeptide repeat protein [Cytophagia bacterium]MBT3422859.1 tetratricopeptide repeat protein [Bacteroidota bacterium]MBT3801430.1 tetratricopeptide repeat protein [Bacteroidota bacterium]MBT3935709.1 tetratricopeptide repeat protein [Bacteroidota bacterium]